LSHLNFGVPGLPPTKSHLTRARIDPAAGSIRFEVLDDRATEFPRVDDRRQASPTRYVMVAHRDSGGQAGAYDQLLRFDLARGTVATRHFPGQASGEAVFAPKAGRNEEEAGYAITFATDLATPESRFIILDAKIFQASPSRS
jgi:carotenoid cleavage dioxygenase-like enzyme